MEIFNLKEHQVCYYYDSSEKPLSEVRDLLRGQEEKIGFLRNEIVFVLKGKLHIVLRDNPGGEVNEGEFVFLSAGDLLNYKAICQSRVCIIRLNGNIPPCNSFSIEKLYRRNKPEKAPDNIGILKMNPLIWYFVNGMTDTLSNGMRCGIYLEAKITELLILLRMCYSDDQLSTFFYPILSPDQQFSESIRKCHQKCKTVKELAALMNMTPKQFTRKFQKVFFQSPYEWMKRERERLIYHEIRTTDKPLKQIAYEQGFLEPAHFTAFCKAAFAKTPEMIRREDQ